MASDDYDFRVVYQYNKYYDSNEHRASKTVPAFQQPESLTATNIADGNTLLTWNTGSADANCQTGDFFEVQRADNADFTGAVDVGSLAFSPATTYNLEDKCGVLNLNGRYYYRVRRNKQPAWGWALMADASVEKSVSHQYVASAAPNAGTGTATRRPAYRGLSRKRPSTRYGPRAAR